MPGQGPGKSANATPEVQSPLSRLRIAQGPAVLHQLLDLALASVEKGSSIPPAEAPVLLGQDRPEGIEVSEVVPIPPEVLDLYRRRTAILGSILVPAEALPQWKFTMCVLAWPLSDVPRRDSVAIESPPSMLSVISNMAARWRPFRI